MIFNICLLRARHLGGRFVFIYWGLDIKAEILFYSGLDIEAEDLFLFVQG